MRSVLVELPISFRCPSSVIAQSRMVVPEAKATILVSDEELGAWFWPPLLVIRAFNATRSMWLSIQGLVKTRCQPPASLNLHLSNEIKNFWKEKLSDFW